MQILQCQLCSYLKLGYFCNSYGFVDYKLLPGEEIGNSSFNLFRL